MVRSATRRGARRPELRHGLLVRYQALAEAFETAGMAELIDSLERGDAITLSSESMFIAHYHGIGPSAADAYAYRTDPDNVRRWLLDEQDVLTELEPAPCRRTNCQCGRP